MRSTEGSISVVSAKALYTMMGISAGVAGLGGVLLGSTRERDHIETIRTVDECMGKAEASGIQQRRGEDVKDPLLEKRRSDLRKIIMSSCMTSETGMPIDCTETGHEADGKADKKSKFTCAEIK